MKIEKLGCLGRIVNFPFQLFTHRLVTQRNPFGNPNKGTQQAKRPLKNPFANINVQQDDNEFQTLNLGNNDHQGGAIQRPFASQVQEDSSRAFFGQPMNANNNRSQPFGGQPENTGAPVQRNSGYGAQESRREQSHSNTSNIQVNSGYQGGSNAVQQPFYTNSSLLGSLSTFNSFLGGPQPQQDRGIQQQQQQQQQAQVYDEDNEPPLLEGKQ